MNWEVLGGGTWGWVWVWGLKKVLGTGKEITSGTHEVRTVLVLGRLRNEPELEQTQAFVLGGVGSSENGLKSRVGGLIYHASLLLIDGEISKQAETM